MLPYVADAENQIGSNLVLHFQVPVLHHARPSEPWRHVVETILRERIQGRVLSVAGRRIGWETRIQALDRGKVVRVLEIGTGRGPAAQTGAEVGIGQRSVVDAVGAPNHRISQAVGRVGKTDSRAKILEVGGSAGGTFAVYQRPELPRSQRVSCGQGQNRLRANCFMPRRLDVPSQAQVEREVFARLEVILHIDRVVILGPARKVRGHL